MKSFLFYIICAAVALFSAVEVSASPTVHIDPPTPILGKPLSILIVLDDEETRLAGLPDLGVFEPLAPPLHSGKEIRLVVLPMRPGEREIPPFPLQVGTARQIESKAMRVTVLEGVAQDAVIAPLKSRPLPIVGSGPGGWIIAGGIVFVILATAFTFFWRWWRRPDFFRLPLELQLIHLSARANRLQPSPERTILLNEIEERRFAPVETTSVEIVRLYRTILALQDGGTR